MTDDERSRLLGFRESPRLAKWAAGALVGSVFAGGCCGGIVVRIVREIEKTGAVASSVGLAAGTLIALVLGTLLTVAETRSRRKRSRQRHALAGTGVVEVTDIVFDRLWTVVDAPDKRQWVVLEARPFVLAHLQVPADEDEHASIIRSVQSGQQPEMQCDGTFPRRRVVIECARLPVDRSGLDRSIVSSPDILLAMRWLDARMESSGVVKYDDLATDCAHFEDWQAVEGLGALATVVPKLVRGPWMMDADVKRL